MLMRIVLAFAILVATPSFAGQNKASQSEDAYSMAIVEHLLKKQSNVTTGWEEKSASRLGDRVSVALLKILSEAELKDPSKIKIYLPLIKSAFQSPELISIPEDKKPKVTIFLLHHLEIVLSDSSLKKEIKQFSEELATKLTATAKHE